MKQNNIQSKGVTMSRSISLSHTSEELIINKTNTAMNIRVLLLLTFSTTMMIGCGMKQSEYDSIKAELETAKKHIIQDSVRISTLRDTITMLSLPANQRLTLINEQVSNGEYSQARRSLDELNRLFPNSKESQQTTAILQRIDNLIEKKKAEEERIKALGFKAIKPVTSINIDYNRVEISSISVGNTFIFDSYGNHWRYLQADKGSKYITALMKITSDSKDPRLPQPAIYTIDGNKMIYQGNFTVRFNRWEDYGTYLGNDHDFSNDFAKTNSIRFKIGIEVQNEITQKPYAIILRKSNSLIRRYDRFENPPVSYNGTVNYPHILSLDDFTNENSQYVIIWIANL